MTMKNSTSPDFNKTFLITANNYVTVIVRYCAPFGGGLDEQWKEPAVPFSFIMNELPIDMNLMFSYNSTNVVNSDGFNEVAYIDGQRGTGFDQYAQYYQNSFFGTDEDSFLTVTGNYPLTGYMSINIYYKDRWGEVFRLRACDKDMLCGLEGMNPFVTGNPSIYSYAIAKDIASINNNPEVKTNSNIVSIKRNDVSLRAGEVPIYRPDEETSVSQYEEYLAPDRNSASYLYAEKDESQDVLILRVKVPTTFISSSSPDLTYGNYQCREINVSSNILETDIPEPLLDFWTVTSLMLNVNKDADGYAYVFFAPTNFVAQLITDSVPQVADCTPPILTWGNYKGYVFGTPTAAIFLRYYGQREDWSGNIENAVPYPSSVSVDMLGDYCPELFGGTMDDFIAGNIGAVNKDSPWPSIN